MNERSLSNLCNLSEAAPNRPQLLRTLRRTTDHNEIQVILMALGEEYYKYADLINIDEKNCTPKRLLFDTDVEEELGEGAKNYLTRLVDRLRQLCE